MPARIYTADPAQRMEVKANTTNEGPVFILKVEQKKIEIKKFKSAG